MSNLARFRSNELVHQGLDRKVKYNLLGDLETIIRLQAMCVVNIMACIAIVICWSARTDIALGMQQLQSRSTDTTHDASM